MSLGNTEFRQFILFYYIQKSPDKPDGDKSTEVKKIVETATEVEELRKQLDLEKRKRLEAEKELKLQVRRNSKRRSDD